MRRLTIGFAVAALIACGGSRASGQTYYQQATQDGPAAFLASLNAWRAMNGRGPLQWDSNLAAYAATNSGVHSPGSSGGGSQVWAGVRSYSHALQMWISSPAHRAILLNATSSIGVSLCPSGTTANAR